MLEVSIPTGGDSMVDAFESLKETSSDRRFFAGAFSERIDEVRCIPFLSNSADFTSLVRGDKPYLAGVTLDLNGLAFRGLVLKRLLLCGELCGVSPKTLKFKSTKAPERLPASTFANWI
jgi:hypothetical protein